MVTYRISWVQCCIMNLLYGIWMTLNLQMPGRQLWSDNKQLFMVTCAVRTKCCIVTSVARYMDDVKFTKGVL
jgi:hypothetical protein